MGKSFKNIFLSLTVGCLLLAFIGFSKAIWNDSEIIGFNISFLSSFINEDLIITVQNDTLSQEVSEIIINGHFQDGLNSWNYLGKVKIIAENANKNYLAIGESYNSNLISENCIFQDVEFKKGSKHLLITYEYFSQDDLQGFDQIAFVVLINDQLVHLESANLNNAGIKQSLFELSIPKNDSYQLRICAGNTGDRLESSWTHLYRISTFVAAINPSSRIRVSNYGQEICASYTINNEQFESCSSNQLLLSFSNLIDNNNLSITSANEPYELPTFVFLNKPNTVEDSGICILNSHQLALFFASELEESHNIKLRYSQDLDNDLWENYQETNHIFLNKLLELQRALCVDNRCLLFFETLTGNFFSELHDLSVLFMLCDPSGQCSNSIKPVILDSCEDLFDGKPAQPILLNEVMFNPLGDDKGDWYEGEWVELYNPNSFEIELSGYRIEDEAGWQVFLSSNNCDNNYHVDDLGETIIEPNGFLVVFMRRRAILNNSGDSVYLYNEHGQIIDNVQFSGSSQENVTYGRFPDGIDNWIMSLSPTPLGSNSLKIN